jgi:hypothetical protein
MKHIYCLLNYGIVLSLSLLLTLSSCTVVRPNTPIYDYFYFSHQSIFLHKDKKQLSSMLLSIPQAYKVQDVQLSSSKEYFAFSAIQDEQYVLFIAKADGSDMKRIHSAPYINFKWSPTKDQLAFIERNQSSSLFFLTKHEIDQAVLIAEAEAFSWSPHGLYLCLMKKETTSHSLHLIRNDGTGLRFVVKGQFIDWNEDGQFFYVAQHSSSSSKLFVFSYDANLHEEIVYETFSDVKLRNSSEQKSTQFSFTIEQKKQFEHYNPHNKNREIVEKPGVIDFVNGKSEASSWEVFIRQLEDRQELVFNHGNEDQVISQGEHIYFNSFSPDELRIIAIVQNGKQKSVQVIDSTNNTWDFIASGESIGNIIWHVDASRLAINIDQKTLLIVFDQNLMVTTLDDTRFLDWKTSRSSTIK